MSKVVSRPSRSRTIARAFRATLIVLALVCLSTEVFAITVDHRARTGADGATIHQPPEKWTYTFSWWPFLKVGQAEITAAERETQPGQREIAVSISGQTSRLIDAIWRYRINAEGAVPLDPLGPGTLEMHEMIKRKPKHTRISYNDGEFYTWRKRSDNVKETRIDAPQAEDILSTLYTVINERLEIGDRYIFETIAGRSRYDVRFEVMKNDRVKVAGKKVDAIKLKLTGADLTDPEDTRKHRTTMLWVSAEPPRRLLQVVSGLWIGTVKVRLRAIEPLETTEPDAPAD